MKKLLHDTIYSKPNTSKPSLVKRRSISEIANFDDFVYEQAKIDHFDSSNHPNSSKPYTHLYNQLTSY